MNSEHERLTAALTADAASTRLAAVLAIGTSPDVALVDVLLERCALEPDFYVRDMLTWALTRLPAAVTVPRLIAELRAPPAQARSQALHTLSKIKDAAAWPAITRALLRDPNDEVARSAWRAAVVLVPAGEAPGLAEELGSQLGRGGRSVQLSLSRALIALGEEAIAPVLRKGAASDDPLVRAHADATAQLLSAPDTAFELAVGEAKRAFVLGGKEPKQEH